MLKPVCYLSPEKTFADDIDQNVNFVKLASAKWMITPMAINIKILGAISIAMGAKLWFILVFLKITWHCKSF